jgi:L-lactate dehydrogenase (cytochrome)
VLPEIVEVAKGKAQIVVDGSFSRGSDIVKAICLGARAVLIGRGYAYGLAAAGKPGVRRALEILKGDVVRTLRLLGCPAITALDRSFVEVPQAWESRVNH